MQTQNQLPEQKTKVLLNVPTYHLADQVSDSDSFYRILDVFSKKICYDGQNCFANMIRRYRASVAYLQSRIKQSSNENLLDLLMLAVYWNEYKGCWGKHIRLKEKALNHLYKKRLSNPSQKPRLDALRGRLAHKWLDRTTEPETPVSLDNVKLLCSWLSATSEYQHEVLRFKSWIDFLETVPESQTTLFLQELMEFGERFKNESKKALRGYTIGVQSFLNKHRENYFEKENFFFTGKREVEYHLNLVGAAIMNQSMRDEFLETEHKVLLLPSCMKKNTNCQAVEIMNGTVCRHCTPECNISKASNEMLRQGVHTFIFNHSTEFSSLLRQWNNQKKVGVIGTACTLNLIQGGLEIKSLHVPAQCIYLNYSGCQKHWTNEGIPTDISLSRLKNMVDVNNSKAV